MDDGSAGNSLYCSYTEDPSSVPNTHVRQLTGARLQGPSEASTGTCIYLHISTHRHTTTYTIKKNLFKIQSKISFLK